MGYIRPSARKKTAFLFVLSAIIIIFVGKNKDYYDTRRKDKDRRKDRRCT